MEISELPRRPGRDVDYLASPRNDNRLKARALALGLPRASGHRQPNGHRVQVGDEAIGVLDQSGHIAGPPVGQDLRNLRLRGLPWIGRGMRCGPRCRGQAG